MKSLVGILGLKIGLVLVFLLLIAWLIGRGQIKKRLNRLSADEISRLAMEKTDRRLKEWWRHKIIDEMLARSRKQKRTPTGHQGPD